LVSRLTFSWRLSIKINPFERVTFNLECHGAATLLDARALVVDDSRTVRTHVRMLLQAADSANFEVIEAADGSEALQWLEKKPQADLPDVILLDRNMPRVSGDACIRILKSDPVWRNIPVLFLTAQADKAQVVKGLALLGADDYLAKPFDAGEMVARVTTLVRMKKAEDKIRTLNKDLEQALDIQRKTNKRLRDALDVISSSIRYASRIQHAILPDDALLAQWIPDYFMLWHPRDVVGGDIYWAKPWGKGILLMLADCTGHGVPGAFMTLIANGALENALRVVEPGDPAGLLTRMHQNVQTILGQDTDGGGSDDGLEVGACYIPPEKQNLTFSGARFSLFIQDGQDVSQIKGDRWNMGYRGLPVDPGYTNQVIPATPGRRFFMITDGLQDQTGGEKGRGYGKRRFVATLSEYAHAPLTEQGQQVYANLEQYRGDKMRLDDITLFGFCLSP